MNRFTETAKWRDGWFSELSALGKLVWFYVIENCDNAGFYEISPRVNSVIIGISLCEYLGAIEEIDDKLIFSRTREKVWVKNFLRYQRNCPLNANNPAHKQIIKLIEQQADNFESLPIEMASSENDAQRPGRPPTKRRTAIEVPGGCKVDGLLRALRARYSIVAPDMSAFGAAINQCIAQGFDPGAVQRTLDWLGAQTAWEFCPGFKTPNQLRDNLPGIYARSKDGKTEEVRPHFEKLGQRDQPLYDYSKL